MENLYASKTFLKMVGRRMHTPHLTPWIRPWPYATETIKKSGTFQSLGTIDFVLFC